MWQVQRYTSFISKNNREFRIEFLIDSATPVTALECTAGVPPLTLQMPDISRTDAIVGTGITVTLHSYTDRQFIDMYTSDIQSTKVRVYRSDYAAGTSGQTYTKIFEGWLDTELYSEPYNVETNYEVSLTANDGKNILSRLSFLDTDDSHYTGIKSHWELLQIVLNRMGVSFNGLYVQNDTVITGGVIPSIYSGPTYIARSEANEAITGLYEIGWAYGGHLYSRNLQNNDAVLLTGQTNASENGLWRAHSGAWTRHESANTWEAMRGMYVLYGGDVSIDAWYCASSGDGTLGTTGSAWAQATIQDGITTFHEAYQKCDNYYDEDGEPMSMMDVLESILRANRARLIISENNVYITNIHTMFSDDITYFSFNPTSYAFIEYVTKQNILDLQYLRRAESSGEISVGGGYNRQEIQFSRYMEDVESSDDSNLERITPEHTFQLVSGYYINTPEISHERWDILAEYPQYAAFNGTKRDEEDDADYHLKIFTSGASSSEMAQYVGPLPYVIGETGKALLITIDGFIEKESNPYLPANIYDWFRIGMKIKIGPYYARTVTYGSTIAIAWSDTFEPTYTPYIQNKPATILIDGSSYIPTENTGYTEGRLILPLLTGLSGDLTIIFTELLEAQVKGSEQGALGWGLLGDKALWVKNLQVRIVDVNPYDHSAVFAPNNLSPASRSNNSTIFTSTDDIVRIGRINALFKNDGQQLSLTAGCASGLGSPFDRGGVMKVFDTDLYQFVKQWYSAGYGGTIEEHLLRTIMSNFSVPSLTLTSISLKTSPCRDISRSVSAVGITNNALSGLTVDGSGVSDSQYVLLTAQTAPAENGVWQVHSGAWNRPAGYTWDDIVNEEVYLGAVGYVSDAEKGGTLDATENNWIVDSLAIHNVLTDKTYLVDNKFMITSAEIDYREAVMNVSMTEIFDDTANIVLDE